MNQSKPQSTLKQSTKVCDCGNTVLVLLTSLNKKYCIDCQKYIDWYLAEGQKSPLTSVIGGPSKPLIQDSTPNVEPAGKNSTMKSTNFLISLNNTTEVEIRALCSAFAQFHRVDVPEEFIKKALMYGNVVENTYIEIVHNPLSISLVNDDNPERVVPITACIEIYKAISELPDNLFSNKPQQKLSSQNTMTVKEAVLEYQEVYKMLIQTANRLNIKPIKGTPLENIQNVLSTLEQGFKSNTVH